MKAMRHCASVIDGRKRERWANAALIMHQPNQQWKISLYLSFVYNFLGFFLTLFISTLFLLFIFLGLEFVSSSRTCFKSWSIVSIRSCEVTASFPRWAATDISVAKVLHQQNAQQRQQKLGSRPLGFVYGAQEVLEKKIKFFISDPFGVFLW